MNYLAVNVTILHSGHLLYIMYYYKNFNIGYKGYKLQLNTFNYLICIFKYDLNFDISAAILKSV